MVITQQVSPPNLFRHVQRLPREGLRERFIVPSRSNKEIVYEVELDVGSHWGNCTCLAEECGQQCGHIQAAWEALAQDNTRDDLGREIAVLETLLRRFERMQDAGMASAAERLPDEMSLRARLAEVKSRFATLSHRVARLSRPTADHWRLWLEGEARPREAWWRPACESNLNWYLPSGRGSGDPLTLEIALLYSSLLDALPDDFGPVAGLDLPVELPDAAILALRMIARWEARVGVELYFENLLIGHEE